MLQFHDLFPLICVIIHYDAFAGNFETYTYSMLYFGI